MTGKTILCSAAMLLASICAYPALAEGGEIAVDSARPVRYAIQPDARVVIATSGDSSCTATIGDLVWDDRDGDGIQDPGEPGIPHVLVELLAGTWPIYYTVAHARTDENGHFLLAGIPGISEICAGEYRLAMCLGKPGSDCWPATLEPSPCHAGGDPARDSNFCDEVITIPADDSQDLTVDFGFHYRPCETGIGDLVWVDTNGNGIQDPGELGLPGALVSLINENNEFVWWTETDGTGHYCFPGLDQGTWRVIADPSEWCWGCVPSPCNVGADPETDSNCDPAWVSMSGSRDLSVDFGFWNEPQGGQGCSPGYWKQPRHFGHWQLYYAPWDPAYPFTDAFPGMSYLDVLSLRGGGLNALGRHAVAAYLNAMSSEVSYDLTTLEVDSRFHAVFPGTFRDYENLKNEFARYNQQFCPLDAQDPDRFELAVFPFGRTPVPEGK